MKSVPLLKFPLVSLEEPLIRIERRWFILHCTSQHRKLFSFVILILSIHLTQTRVGDSFAEFHLVSVQFLGQSARMLLSHLSEVVFEESVLMVLYVM